MTKGVIWAKRIVLIGVICLASCGYRGALYIPDKAPANKSDQQRPQQQPVDEGQ